MALTAPAAATASQSPQPAQALGADAVWAWWWPGSGELAATVGDYGFERVYLYCEGGFDAKVKHAIAALRSRGIDVEALGGEPRWGTTQRKGLLEFVRSARRYQRSAPPAMRLAGIHLDVEPYDLPAWDRDPGAVSRSLLASMRSARRAAGPLPLSADIPYWYDRPLARALIRATDATTIMAYRDSAPEILDAARDEVEIAGRLGRKATVGVETDDVSPASVTFFQEGTGALVEAVGLIESDLAGEPGFGGVAVHHLESLQRLVP